MYYKSWNTLCIDVIPVQSIFFFCALLFLFTTITSLLFNFYLGLYGIFFLNFFSIICFWFATIYQFNRLFITNNIIKINLGNWFFLPTGLKISFDFFIDAIAISFFLLTLTIAVFVYIYAFSYFRYEPLTDRLLLFLNLFILSMLFLVSSGNLIMFFLGWELIGLTSFLLINFWSARIGTFKSAFKAYSFNKLSDFFLFFSLLVMFIFTSQLDIIELLNTVPNYANSYLFFFFIKISFIELVSTLLILCAFIKSAQLGFHLWLPDSMEAPVPASSLIHSATLVSAGIFIFLRFSALFELSIVYYYTIPIVGSLTAFYGGACAAFQTDLKKILAYSTISHCGFLVVLCYCKVVEYTVLYLYVHGFFKAAVFMCVGNIIRFSKNYQDFRKIGQLYKYMPFECFAAAVCLFNLAGLPFSYGFYIKHLLFISLGSTLYYYYLVLSLCSLAAITGIFYSLRIIYYSFFDVKKGKKHVYYSNSRLNLKSKYYSNSSFSAEISITALILVAYFITIYLFYIYKNFFFSDFILNFNYSVISESLQFNKTLQNSYSYLNWTVLLFLLSVIFVNWKKLFYSYKNYNIYFSFIIFIILFWQNYLFI